MKGGYQIIDLTGLDLEVKSEQTSISDPKILKQLDGLKSYIEDGYNYSKPLNNQLKPILLRFRDKKTDEKQEASVWANLSKKTNNLTFVIEAVIDSTNLSAIQIEIVFELKQDEADNYYYGIKTAKYLMKSNIVDVVNDAIEDGDIPIGTKLYEHRITDPHDSFTLFVISTSSTSYESLQIGDSIYIGHGVISMCYDENATLLSGITYSDAETIDITMASGEVNSLELDGTLSDTVTAL